MIMFPMTHRWEHLVIRDRQKKSDKPGWFVVHFITQFGNLVLLKQNETPNFFPLGVLFALVNQDRLHAPFLLLPHHFSLLAAAAAAFAATAATTQNALISRTSFKIDR